MQALHDIRFFVGEARNAKEQKTLLLDFADTLLLKNALRGRNGEEPLDSDKTLDLAKQILQKHGFSNNVTVYSTDPYSGAIERRTDKDKQIEDLKAKVGKEML